MSLQLDRQIAPTGTKFRVFPLPRYAEVPSFAEPETITISVPAGSVQAGPADDRMYVVDAANKQPYDRFTSPPYLGASLPKVEPNAQGHFDEIDLDSRAFLVATMYATVRRVLDIWEDYFGRRIEWHFTGDFERMELIPLINWNNAQSGYGFLEFGYGSNQVGGINFQTPYCENFDVLSHELGHSIIFAEVGVPSSNLANTSDYGGFHESAGDLVAIVSLLHFESVVDHLLENSHGNLFTVNELNRVGELSASSQIRLALNYLKMSDVGSEAHDRSEPLTGAYFDIFVEIFQRRLVENGAITQALAEASLGPEGASENAEQLQADFDAAYAAAPNKFKMGLLEARDEFARLLAAVWADTPADHLTYAKLAATTIRHDRLLNGGKNVAGIRASFVWREITVPPPSPLRAMWRVDRFLPSAYESQIETLAEEAGRAIDVPRRVAAHSVMQPKVKISSSGAKNPTKTGKKKH
jgi:hypothetical protein